MGSATGKGQNPSVPRLSFQSFWPAILRLIWGLTMVTLFQTNPYGVDDLHPTSLFQDFPYHQLPQEPTNQVQENPTRGQAGHSVALGQIQGEDG